MYVCSLVFFFFFAYITRKLVLSIIHEKPFKRRGCTVLHKTFVSSMGRATRRKRVTFPVWQLPFDLICLVFFFVSSNSSNLLYDLGRIRINQHRGRRGGGGGHNLAGKNVSALLSPFPHLYLGHVIFLIYTYLERWLLDGWRGFGIK